MEPKGLLKLASVLDDEFDIVQHPEKYLEGKLTRNSDDSYVLAFNTRELDYNTSDPLSQFGCRAFHISERKARYLSAQPDYKEFFEQADTAFTTIQNIRNNERRLKTKRKMKKGLISFVAGLGLASSAWLANNHFTSQEYKRACELDAKAVYIVNKGNQTYDIDNISIRTYASRAGRLEIQVDNKIAFVSESWGDYTPSDDARFLEKIFLSSGEDNKGGTIWTELNLEEIGNLQNLQKKYENLIEKIYEKEEEKKFKEKAKLEETKKTIKSLTDKL